MRHLPLFLALLGFTAGPARAQGVLVAPHAVFVDHRTRSAWIQLHNTGTEATEVSIETLFGYPVTDSAGRLELRYVEQPDSTVPSAAGWIQAFPRRTTVPAQGRQTIRLLVTPPASIPDGEYWARLAITAKAGALPVTGADSAAGITVGLNLEVRTIIPLNYRKGAVATGIAVTNLRTEEEADSLVVRARLERRGSAAFIGSVRGTLLREGGAVVGGFESPISVYYDIDPRFALPRAGLAPGRYRLRLEVVSERADIAPEYLIQMAAVRDSVTVRIR